MHQPLSGRRNLHLPGALVALMAPCLATAANPGGDLHTPLVGFFEHSIAAERQLEDRFQAELSGENILANVREMSSAPNHIGSQHNRENALATMQMFRDWGWDAHIETFDVLYPTPRRVSLEMLAPARYSATLDEPPLPGDKTSANAVGVLPGYFVYGADGSVTAPLVYVNYGLADDYETLARLGISVRGKIVIARFGQGWRGLKPRLAYEHGAVGCVVFSDPAADGYAQGDTYPRGAWRPAVGIERGSVLDLPVAPGDPLTPGIGATDSARRLTAEQAPGILKIPTLPISYGDAQHFLAALTGPVAPQGWRGALPLTYHIGPGPALVRLSVESDWQHKPIYNVIAEMKGHQWPEQWIIRGNNRDAWVYGAWVSLSGHSAMLEEARAIGLLSKSGWRPRRTIIYASWDGEEAGLLGSTEWVETHAAELRDKAALYVNTGPYGRGFLGATASYSTQQLLEGTAADVLDPETQASVLDRAIAVRHAELIAAARPGDATAPGQARLPVGDMGAGSDYTPFVQHLGIASMDLDYSGEDEQAGVYHSAYDTYEHFERFGDPTGAYGAALAATAGRVVLRAASAEILPLRFGYMADRIHSQVVELHSQVTAMRASTIARNAFIAHGGFALATDPRRPTVPPVPEVPVPDTDFSALDAASAALMRSARHYDELVSRVNSLPAANLTQVNDKLQHLEQCMIDPDGLPGRPWYRHLVYAPGLATGYAAKTIPGVREAIEDRRWADATEFVKRTATALQRCSRELDEAAILLRP